MSRNHELPPARVLPPKWKFCIEAGFFRAFTWRERVQILFGYSARLDLKVATEHSPGKFEPKMTLTTTKALTAEPMKKP